MEIKYQGKNMSVHEVAKIIGVTPNAIKYRIAQYGGKQHPAIFSKKHAFKGKNVSRYKIYVQYPNGQKIALRKLAEKASLPYDLVWDRYRRGHRNTNVLTARSQNKKSLPNL